MPQEMTLTEATRNALEAALSNSTSLEELSDALKNAPPPQCSPHGSRCSALAVEYLLLHASGEKKAWVHDILSENLSVSMFSSM